MSALDKFKRRLVRDIARRIHQEKQMEYDMWIQLKQEYGCDCNLLWEHMRALTLKKLKRLLAAQDRVDCITRIARMTSTDWLTFDLVLVHDKIDVIGENMILDGHPEPALLTELFELVWKYDIEKLPPLSLIEAWFNLTKEYNTGGRQCSPMLLQRRWYQLKELTRSRVYNFWKLYRGNPKHLDKADTCRPSALQLMIAERYPTIITQRFEQWGDLLLKKQVVSAGAFERMRMSGSENNTNDTDLDLIVIEPKVETIELAADSDNDDTNITSNSSKLPQRKANVWVTIKTEPPDEVIHLDDDVNIVQRLPSFEIPIKNNEKGLENETLSKINTEVIKPGLTEISDLKLPKITNVMGNVTISESYTEINELIDNEDKVKEKSLGGESAKISSKIPLSDKVTESDKDEFDEDNNTNCESNIVTNLDELPLNLNFVDDGIELVEHDVDNIDRQKQGGIEGEQLKNKDTARHEDTSVNIDKKLIMFPITYTKKLDHMNIFNDKSYFTVKGDHVIKSAIAESKPIFKDVFSNTLDEDSNKDMNEDVNRNQTGDDDSESYEVPRVNCSSWLLQKPKNRSYNPIQLCKNPDFNTRLKRLTVGFFSIERNRDLFNACKPLTIDLHKQFENKLVNNTLYLQTTNSLETKQEKNCDTCKNTTSVIPSAIPVQSLLVKSTVGTENLLPKNLDNVESECHTNSPTSDSNHVNNLLEIDQLRLVNKNLLTVEISPIPLNDTSFTVKPPVQLIKSPDPKGVIDLQSSSVSTNDIQEKSSALGPNDKKKKILPKKFLLPKTSPFGRRPAWSIASIVPEPVDSYLITKDTLDKVFCVLKGIEVKGPKKKKKSTMMKAGRGSIDIKQSFESNDTNQEINENSDEPAKIINDDELKKSVTFLQTQNTELSKLEGKIMWQKPCRMVSSKAKYCCWAKCKSENFVNNKKGPKPKHRCPESYCMCCCRYLLYKTVICEEEYLNVSNSHSAEKESDALATKNAKMGITFRQVENNFVENSLPPNEVAERYPRTISIDTTSDPNSNCSIQCPILTNIIPDSFGAVSFDAEANMALQPKVCLKNDVGVDADEMFLPVNSVHNSINKRSGLHTNLKRITMSQANNVHHNPRVKTNILQSPLHPYVFKPIDKSKTAIETISLLDDEPTSSTNHSSVSLPAADTITGHVLPEGVNLVLLPDNSLSVNINPDVVIDQESLSKLPVILEAVRKRLNESIFKSKCETNEAVKSDDNLNVSCKILTEQKLEQIVFNSEINSNNLLDVPKNLAETGSNNLNNVNFETDKSDNVFETIPANSETNEPLLENDVFCTKKNEDKLETMQSEVIKETDSCYAKTDIHRKSILSDLMTMSGISPEDVNTTGEGSVSLPPTVVNSSLNNSSVAINNENTQQHTIDGKKIVKKIMISIRKKSYSNGQISTDSIIDLTEDNDKTTAKAENNKELISPLRKLLKKYMTKFKEGKPVNESPKPVKPVNESPKPVKPVNESPKPVKLFKSSKLLLRNASGEVTPCDDDADSRLKLIIAKHYRQYNRKPTSLKVLQLNGDVAAAKSNQEDNRITISCSDSSDDEPLAKKSKRIRGNEDANSQELAQKTVDSIVEVPVYDVPVEFYNETTGVAESSDRTDTCRDVEENCILGV